VNGSRTLLEPFQPCLRYDSAEAYFADSAEEWTANPPNSLRTAGGELIAGAGEELSLDFLRAGSYPGGHPVAPDDRIEAASDDYSDQYLRLRQARPDLRNVIYGRALRRHQRLWLQYWFFYFLNDYQLAWGIDVHEGDWEMVQFRLDENESAPEIAVYAQHAFCEVRAWDDVGRLAGEKEAEGLAPEEADRDRPMVYVGRGSHASFFEPGYHPTDFYDVTDGRRRPKTEVRLEVIGDDGPSWVGWPGRWGGSRTGYPGPTAPCAHDQWDNPEKLMEHRAVVPEDARKPDEPRLWARRRRNRLLIEFDFSPMPAPPKRLVATVNSQDEPTVPPQVHRFALRTVVLGSLQTRIELDPEKHYDVSLAVVDSEDKPTAAEVFVFAPSAGFRGVIRRLGAAAGRLVHLWRMALGRA
jgi:hypothetical protein